MCVCVREKERERETEAFHGKQLWKGNIKFYFSQSVEESFSLFP